MNLPFRDRVDAGKRLAQALEHLRGRTPLVLGLARGGLVLAAQIARELGCELEVLVARKVGAPHQPECGIGAVAPGGVSVHDSAALERLALSEAEFRSLAAREAHELERRLALYRHGPGPPKPQERTAIVVDDGLATGVTALAACRYVRSLKPAWLVLAVPVCTARARELLEGEIDEFVCLAQPEPFYAVGQWYANFSQVEDEEVLEIMKCNKELSS